MTRAAVIWLAVLGILLAELCASAPAQPALPSPRRATAYGPRSLVTHIDGVKLRRRRLMPADVSGTGLGVGERYEVQDVQFLYGPPVASGTYDGKPIALPMNLTTVSRATGMTWEPRHTAPEFAVFVLRKVGVAPTVPTGSNFLLRIFTDAQGKFLRAEPVPDAPTVPL